MSEQNLNSMPPTPPAWAIQLLTWFADPDRKEEVQGDMLEMHAYWLQVFGERKANRLYVLNALKLLKPFARQKQSENYPHTFSFSYAMIRNYFKIAFRNLAKNKGYSVLNIGGLGIGMAVAMLIGLWVYDELSFNQYHKNYDEVSQVLTRYKEGHNNSMPYPLYTELKNNFGNNFKYLVRSSWELDYILSAGEKKLSRKGRSMDRDAPQMLTLNMLYGTRDGLADIHSIMLSASTARALFGDKSPLRQIIRINNKTNVRVTGVYEDVPLNSEFSSLAYLTPFDLWKEENPWISARAAQDWNNHFLTIYAQINPNGDFGQVSNTIKDAEIKNLGEFKELAAQKPQVFLHPMSRWHLYGFDRGKQETEPLRLVWTVGIIGSFVLLLACINFMNLSTARSEKRAREVGVRKAIGSFRRQLVYQFFSESFLVVLIAFALSLLLATLFLPWFNNFAMKQMSMPWFNAYFWAFNLGFILITGILAGSYPAFYLSSFQPVKVLKGTFYAGRFAAIPRKVLVVTQFTVSISLIIGTIIIIRQISVAKDRPVGYRRDGLITLQMRSGDFYGKYEILRNELKATGAVWEMSESMGEVTTLASGNNGFTWKGGDSEKQFGTIAVTHEHGETVGWQFIQGRDFSRDIPTDSSAIVINEAAMKFMSLASPLGEPVRWNFQNKAAEYKIIGVIENMIMESPYDAVEPTIFFVKALNGGVDNMHIKINPHVSATEALPKIEAVFKQIIPAAPFDYQFVDDEYAKKFEAEERIGKLATLFATLTILISCLGLFGLASFTAEQRTKEIGIRKVLGASVSNLWQMLSKDFIILVVISCVLAAPLAYYFMSEWLQKYTYRAELSWWIFAASAAGALAVTLLTVSYQAIRAALLNPVKSLRSE